jgi:predicted amidohydrolase
LTEAVVSIVSGLSPPPNGSHIVLSSVGEEYTPQNLAPRMLAKASRYAKLYGVYFIPARFACGEYLCLCLLAPDGSLVGAQRAVTLNLHYRGLFLRHDHLDTFETSLGKIALLVDVDINMPEVVRAAAHARVDLLFSSQHIHASDFSEDRLLFGAVNAAASNRIPVAAIAGNVGLIADNNGCLITEITETFPITSAVSLGCLAESYDLMAGKRLINTHQTLFSDDGEVTKIRE